MSEFRVIYHERHCPDCGSDDITEQEIEITDGSTETALACQACGAAWPIACVAEQLEPDYTETATTAHLVLQIDARPPGTEAAQRRYWCPSCDAYLTGTELAKAPVLHYTPGPDRVITPADLTTAGVQR
jgi:predicted RNA-binding Zn-ribbon protein involved in translation (DUF1610 family)